MSIYNLIGDRIRDGRLFWLEPLYRPRGHRHFYASREIYDLLYGQPVNAEWDVRRMELLGDIDQFVQGGLVNVVMPDPQRPYDVKNAARLRLLFPKRDEVWEFRSTHANPEMSVRIFGRFASKDRFIGLSWFKRPYLGPPRSPQWNRSKVECKTLWTNMFEPYPPLRGESPDEYVSNYVSI